MSPLPLRYRYVDNDGKLDVEEYIDDGIIKIAENEIFDVTAEQNFFPIELEQVTQLSREAAGHDWRRLAWHLP